MARRSKNQILEKVRITGIADKGKAVGRTHLGEVVFVDDAVPGDLVDVRVIRKKKSLAEGVVIQFQELSLDRVTPSCRHFGICGGCKWQHLDYQAQLLHKEQTVRDCMQRIARLDPQIVLPIIGCSENFRYRNKLEFSFSNRRWLTKEETQSEDDLSGQGALGFHRPGFFDKIVAIEECLLQDPLSNDIRNFVREYTLQQNLTYFDPRAHEGLMRNMIVRNTTLGEWMVIVVFGYRDEEVIESMMSAIQVAFPQITSLLYVINEKNNDTIFDREVFTWHGRPYIVEKLGHTEYRIGPKSFFQTNPKQAMTLFDVAREFAEFSKEDNVYDLYTGLGSIALYISEDVAQVTGIEEIPEAIADAHINKELNKITNASFYAGDVKDLLNEDFIQRHGKADVIITDPPRQGMHEKVVETILELETPRIVYISCNPATQARDLALLSKKYTVTKVQPVDMFPHTHHIESVAQLVLTKEI